MTPTQGAAGFCFLTQPENLVTLVILRGRFSLIFEIFIFWFVFAVSSGFIFWYVIGFA